MSSMFAIINIGDFRKLIKINTAIHILLCCHFIIIESGQAFFHDSLNIDTACITSTQQIKRAHFIEGNLMNYLLYLIQSNDPRSEEYSHYIAWVNKTLSDALSERRRERAPTILEHPLNSLHFIKRIVLKVNPIFRVFITTDIFKDLNAQNIHSRFLMEMRHITCWLKKKDLSTFYDLLLNALMVYRMSTKTLISGNFYGYEAIYKLTSNDFTELIRKTSLRGWKNFATFLTLHPLVNLSRQQKLDVKQFNMKYVRRNTKTANNGVLASVSDLCRLGIKSSELWRSLQGLNCYYSRPLQGWYLVKTEVLNYEPKILRFLNVIHDEEIESFIKLARKSLDTARVYRVSNQTSIFSNTRICQTSWLADSDDSLAKNLSARVALITELNVVNYPQLQRGINSEQWQIGNYGVLGYFDKHLDVTMKTRKSRNGTYLPLPDDKKNDRFATWMFYLTDVDLGGGTAFVWPKRVAEAIKGSAVFWYNKFPNGSAVDQTAHSGCPVLVGEKWIANKWVLEDNQMFIRKCKSNRYAEMF